MTGEGRAPAAAGAAAGDGDGDDGGGCGGAGGSDVESRQVDEVLNMTLARLIRLDCCHRQDSVTL